MVKITAYGAIAWEASDSFPRSLRSQNPTAPMRMRRERQLTVSHDFVSHEFDRFAMPDELFMSFAGANARLRSLFNEMTSEQELFSNCGEEVHEITHASETAARRAASSR